MPINNIYFNKKEHHLWQKYGSFAENFGMYEMALLQKINNMFSREEIHSGQALCAIAFYDK